MDCHVAGTPFTFTERIFSFLAFDVQYRMERSLEPLCDMIGIRIFFPGKAIVYIGSADGSLVPVVREARPEDDLLVQASGRIPNRPWISTREATPMGSPKSR